MSHRRVLGEIVHIRAYIDRIDAVEGQGGDRTTFRVACLIARAMGGNFTDTLNMLREWNDRHAHPRWSDKELAHKARRAIQAVGLAA